jgi:predicted HTH domain antitoxin
MRRTNVLLTDSQHKAVKAYAKKEGKTLGRMVREALDVAYQKKDPLESRRDTAIAAYGEGFVSLGKLAEVLGLDPISARDYLRKAGIPLLVQSTEEIERDADNA